MTMFVPVETTDSTRPAEFANRIRQVDAKRPATSRDFANEIREVQDERKREHPQQDEPQPDTYESSTGDPAQESRTSEDDVPTGRDEPDRRDNAVDVTI